MGNRYQKSNRGSTMVEFAILVVVISAFTLIILPLRASSLHRQKIAEADASLACIRTQLNAYYGANGSYPMQLQNGYVIGAYWNDMTDGALEGRHFGDTSYVYYGHPNGKMFKLTCRSVDFTGSDRILDESGSYTFE